MSGSNARRIRAWAATLVAVTGMAAIQADADTYYVNGTCGNDAWSGTSSVCSAPDGPKRTIQAGIDASVNGDTVIVADGVYTGDDNRDLDYAGRLIAVRSENGSQGCIIDCEANDADRHRAFNFHTNETLLAIVDGFTIRNGYRFRGGGIRCANGSGPQIRNCTFVNNTAIESGGGMYTVRSNPIVTDCSFSRNYANLGGGMYNDDNSSPTVTNSTFGGNLTALDGGGMYNFESNPTVTGCSFSDNSALFGGGMYNHNASNPIVTICTFSGNSTALDGGGMYNFESNPTVTICTFSGNSADSGGGMHNLDSSPIVTHCTFSGNSTDNYGGGMLNVLGIPTVINCTFSGNSADFYGGGMLNETSGARVTNCTFIGNSTGSGGGMCNINNSTPTVTNCTFSGNHAVAGGGGMYNDCISRPTVTNCILWDNSPDEIVDAFGAITTVRYSDVQGGWPGTGNIDADPFFVDPANGDYRLAPSSPCIDAADNTAVPAGILTDLDGKPRFVDVPATPDTGVPGGAGGDAIVDMGAYEFPCDPCDMNCDGTVDAVDIEFFIDILFNGATPCDPCTGDTNGDLMVNAGDIEGFINCLFP